MMEQLPHGNLLQARIDLPSAQRPKVSKQLEDVIVEPQLPFLDQLQDPRGREWFGATGKVEERCRLDLFPSLDIRPAVATRHDQSALLDDCQSSARDAALCQRFPHDFIEVGQTGSAVPCHEDGTVSGLPSCLGLLSICPVAKLKRAEEQQPRDEPRA